MKTLLIVDDDRLLCRTVQRHFEDTFDTICAHTGTEGIQCCIEKKVDMVLMDQQLPDGNGADFCHSVIKHNDSTKIIFITAFPSFSNAVKAIRIGAHNYLSKPFELEELELAVFNAARTIDLEKIETVQTYQANNEKENTLIGNYLTEVKQIIELASKDMSNVLITGETGTGKGVTAKMIHYQSAFGNAPFILINCSAFPENLIESELFGHEKNAFTGAQEKRRGIFELADGGTLFLDEIGELPLHLQSKLLTVLDEKAVRRIGGESTIPVNVRIVAATNADIEKKVEKNEFRSDLFFRLNLIRLHLPPLRERRRDIKILCKYFIEKFRPDREFVIPDSEISKLEEYDWPGNIRELKNIIERTIILSSRRKLLPSRFIETGANAPPRLQPKKSVSRDVLTLRQVEKEHIRYCLKILDQNKTRTAEKLGISRSTLIRKIQEYGL